MIFENPRQPTLQMSIWNIFCLLNIFETILDSFWYQDRCQIHFKNRKQKTKIILLDELVLILLTSSCMERSVLDSDIKLTVESRWFWNGLRKFQSFVKLVDSRQNLAAKNIWVRVSICEKIQTLPTVIKYSRLGYFSKKSRVRKKMDSIKNRFSNIIHVQKL